MRAAKTVRTTKETNIEMSLELDAASPGFFGKSGIGFFDHMLNSFCVHGGFRIEAGIEGDTYVDDHHTIEDVGIVIGQLFSQILGNKGGINRFGQSLLPMDEALVLAAADISGRPYLVYDLPVVTPMTGQYSNQMTEEFFRALAFNAGVTLHVKCMYGQNDHHKIEAAYKAVARALSSAAGVRAGGVLSAKGVL